MFMAPCEVMQMRKDPVKQTFNNKSKPTDIRISNIQAAKAVSDAIRTSLGPRGMDKMIQTANAEVSITNDGATILKQMKVLHPAAKMLVELSRSQDIETGDGTTTVVIIAGALLDAAAKLLQLGIHPTAISESFQRCSKEAVEILTKMSSPVKLNDTEVLVKSAATALNSKVVSQQSSLLAPIAVNAVLKITEPGREDSIDLKNIKVIKTLGGTVEDTSLVEGLVLNMRSVGNNSPSIVEKAKIGLIQFCISAPKTDMDHNIIVTDYTAMDRVLKEERAYILNIVKQIKKTGCNVLLVQKCILRESISDLAQHFLDKIKCLVVKDIDREDIEFICKALNCGPIASLDHFTAENLVQSDLVEEISCGSKKLIKITGIHNAGRTVSIICRGSNKLVLEEAARSLHDALCVVRCLVKKPAQIVGGGAPEIEVSLQLAKLAQTAEGVDSYCFRAFSEALEIIPFTLAENAGLNPIASVTDLRNRHAQGEINSGINVRRGCVTDMHMENVLQPLIVCTSAITLATETVRSILKIDDIVNTF